MTPRPYYPNHPNPSIEAFNCFYGPAVHLILSRRNQLSHSGREGSQVFAANMAFTRADWNVIMHGNVNGNRK